VGCWLAALGDNAEAVVLEVSEAVGAALDELHFSVEALGDAVVFGEAPHGGQGFAPRVEGSGQRDQRLEAAVAQFFDGAEEFCRQRSALGLGAVFGVKQPPNIMHFFVQRAQSRAAPEEGAQALALGGSEVFRALAPECQEAAVVLCLRGDLADEFQEVRDDGAHGVEAVGNDLGLGEAAGDEVAVGAGKVDTDDADLVPAAEAVEVGAQLGQAAAGDDVEDTVVFEVGESGGKAQAAVERVLVDAEHGRAVQAQALGGFAPGELGVDARDGCRAELAHSGHR